MTAQPVSLEQITALRDWCKPLPPDVTVRKQRQPAQCWETLTAICDELLALRASEPVGEQEREALDIALSYFDDYATDAEVSEHCETLRSLAARLSGVK